MVNNIPAKLGEGIKIGWLSIYKTFKVLKQTHQFPYISVFQDIASTISQLKPLNKFPKMMLIFEKPAKIIGKIYLKLK